MEKYLTIDEYMDTLFAMMTFVASMGSLYFIWKGYELASDHLNQHKKKIKEENRNKIIIECILKLSDIRVKLVGFYGIEFSIFNDNDILELESELKRIKARIDLNKKIHLEQVYELNSVITFCRLLKNENIITSMEKCFKTFNALQIDQEDFLNLIEEHSYWLAYKKAQEMAINLEINSTQGNLRILQDDFLRAQEFLVMAYDE